MSKHHPQSEGMKALEQSLNDHMEICRLKRKAKRLKSENARLKAEVAELKNQPDPLTAYLYAAELAKDEVKHLKAEVDRLRKAGDEMHRAIKVSDPILDWKIELWNAAKEGKPSV